LNVSLRHPLLELSVASSAPIRIGTPVVTDEARQDRPNLVVRPARQNEAAIGLITVAPFITDAVHGEHSHGLAVGGLAPARSGGPFSAGSFLVVGPDGLLVDVDAIDEPRRNIVAQAIVGTDQAGRLVAVRLMASILRVDGLR
jgi:hypothetical protein